MRFSLARVKKCQLYSGCRCVFDTVSIAMLKSCEQFRMRASKCASSFDDPALPKATDASMARFDTAALPRVKRIVWGLLIVRRHKCHKPARTFSAPRYFFYLGNQRQVARGLLDTVPCCHPLCRFAATSARPRRLLICHPARRAASAVILFTQELLTNRRPSRHNRDPGS
jgi:hypothetical protein